MSSEPTHLLQCAPTQKQSVKKEKNFKRPPGGQVRKRSLIFIQKKKNQNGSAKELGNARLRHLLFFFFSIAGGPLHPLFFNDTVTSQLEQMEEEKKRPTL